MISPKRYLFLAGGLLGEKDSLDVGQDTSLSDGDARKELVQLLVVADSQLQMTGDDPRLLVVAGGVAGQLEDLSSQVLHDGCEVHGGTGTYTLGVVALAEQTVHTANRELKAGTGRARFRLGASLASFATSRHSCRLV